jgi:hypothetical protein
MGVVRAHTKQRNRGLERSIRFIATHSPGALVRTGDGDDPWPTGEVDSIRIFQFPLSRTLTASGVACAEFRRRPFARVTLIGRDEVSRALCNVWY